MSRLRNTVKDEEDSGLICGLAGCLAAVARSVIYQKPIYHTIRYMNLRPL